jgi:hypothetical protein
MPLLLLIGACHSNPEATPCGQSGDAPCDADAGLLCVEESENAPQTCESTISCLQPLGASAQQYAVVPSTWALAQQDCNNPQLAGTPENIVYLAATPCDGLVAFSEPTPGNLLQTGLYPADGGALVAIFQAGEPSACIAGDVSFSASCLQTLWNEQILCRSADAGPDSSDAN